MAILLVFIGGGIGSVLRFLMNELFAKILTPGESALAHSTLAVNVIGSFSAGVLLFLAANNMDFSDAKRLFFMVGVCGGFTTFSGVSAELFKMLQHGDAVKALCYISISVVVSLAATAAGFFSAKSVL